VDAASARCAGRQATECSPPAKDTNSSRPALISSCAPASDSYYSPRPGRRERAVRGSELDQSRLRSPSSACPDVADSPRRVVVEFRADGCVADLLCSGGMATTIPQNKLRNQVGEVLRRAEQGERFIVTVSGRPTAELGPLPGDRAPARALRDLLAKTPVDRGFAADVRQMRTEDEAVAVDPWQ
jgi:prevent-host-death family protein